MTLELKWLSQWLIFHGLWKEGNWELSVHLRPPSESEGTFQDKQDDDTAGDKPEADEEVAEEAGHERGGH